MASFLDSLVNIAVNFAVTIVNGVMYQPATKLRTGSVFTDMSIPINYVNQAGEYFLGQAFGSASVLSNPSFQQAQAYQPGQTTPPRTFPTTQANGYQVPMGVNPISQYRFSAEALRVLKSFEGLHQRAYMIGSDAFIGYGSKLSKFDPNLYISRDQAEQMLALDISDAEGLVKGAVSVPLTQGQFDALVDFAFTLTPDQFKKSTVVQQINAGNIPGAATSLAQWVYATQNGVVAKVPHLVSRRTFNVGWLTMPIDPRQVS